MNQCKMARHVMARHDQIYHAYCDLCNMMEFAKQPLGVKPPTPKRTRTINPRLTQLRQKQLKLNRQRLFDDPFRERRQGDIIVEKKSKEKSTMIWNEPDGTKTKLKFDEDGHLIGSEKHG